jgi:hypothetical protein
MMNEPKIDALIVKLRELATPFDGGTTGAAMVEAASALELLSASKPAAPQEYVYETYTGQCGWLVVSKEEYEHSEYRKRRTPLAASPAAPSHPTDAAAPAKSGAPVYQLKLASGDWRDQDEIAYRNNVKYYPADVRIVYAAPQPAQIAPSAVVLDDERAAFEAWWASTMPKQYQADAMRLVKQSRAGDGKYGLICAQDQWESWQARAASPQPVAQPVLAAQLDDARRYQLCRESAIERGLFQTGGEYDAMVDSSLLKNGKEPLTGRGHNYGKKVAKDGSLYRTQLMEQTPAVTLLGDGATTLWRVANAPQAGRGLAFHRPFVLQRQEIGVTVCYCPDGRLKRWKSETEAQRVCNRLNTAIAASPQATATQQTLTDVQIASIYHETIRTKRCDGQIFYHAFARALLTAAQPASGGDRE